MKEITIVFTSIVILTPYEVVFSRWRQTLFTIFFKKDLLEMETELFALSLSFRDSST